MKKQKKKPTDDYVVEFNWFQLVDLLKKVPTFENGFLLANKQVRKLTHNQ